MIAGDELHLLDGAMGTLLYERGVFVNVCYDALNLTEPELVEGIHREYVEAGAEILETNSFGANRVRLSGFGLEERAPGDQCTSGRTRPGRRGGGRRCPRVDGSSRAQYGPIGSGVQDRGPWIFPGAG